jgi:peptidoglycan/LPS O-acetylase OafA/YrhL
MYFEGLDIIRLLGFVWVFLHHIQIPVLLIKENGWIGMDLLFTLSGFLITSNFLGKPVALKNFYVKRILRIWPLYFLYLFLIGHYQETWLYMLFAGNWQVMLHGWSNFVLVGHLWAVSMQEQFYLVFPLLFKHLKSVIFWGLILSTALKFVFFDPKNYFTIYMNTFTRLEPFLLGSLLALYKEKIKKQNAKVWLIFILGLVSFNLIDVRQSQNIWLVVAGYLFIAIWCASALHLTLQISNLKFQTVRRFASLGFGLYVWHKLGIEWSKGNPFLAFVITSVLAYISYEVYEKWFYKLKNNFRS